MPNGNPLSRFTTLRQRGSALVLTLLISAVLLFVGLGLSYSVMQERQISVFDRDYKAARYVAEQGLRHAEEALERSYSFGGWNDDLDIEGSLGRPTHPGDQPPLNLQDASLNRNGLVVYRWAPTGAVEGALFQVPQVVQDHPARFSVWVRNNADDYGSTITADADNMVSVVSLGELLDDGGNVKARAYLIEMLMMSGSVIGNYPQKGLGAGGHSTLQAD